MAGLCGAAPAQQAVPTQQAEAAAAAGAGGAPRHSDDGLDDCSDGELESEDEDDDTEDASANNDPN